MRRSVAKKPSVGATGRRTGGSGGGQIAWFHVLLALVFLIVFGASFGVVFEYAPLALQSLEADLDGPMRCTVSVVVAVANVTCEGGAEAGVEVPCYVVRGTATLSHSLTSEETRMDAGNSGNSSNSSVAVNAANDSANAATISGTAELRTASTTTQPAVADDLIVHAYYGDYYTNRHCTFTMCDDGGAGGGRLTAGRRSKLRLLKMAAAIESSSQLPPSGLPEAPTEQAELATDSVGTSSPSGVSAFSALRLPITEKVPPSGWTMRCWLDRRKPDRAFLGLNEFAGASATPEAESGESSLPLERAEAYAVLAAPPTVMLACVAALVACVATGRLRADEVHQPVVTPSHIQIDGRWYVRTPKPPAPAADDDRSPGSGVGGTYQHDSGKWQALKQALYH